MDITSIQSKVMLCSVTISTWIARRYDGKVTEEVENKRHTKGIGRFNKRLLPEHAPNFAEVVTLAVRIRSYFYDHTLKYDQLGVHLLPTMVYMDFAEKMRSLKDEFDLAVSVFLNDYLNLKEAAREELNGLTTLKSELDQHVLASIATANDDLVRRLYEAVSQMANRLYATGNVRLDVANNVRELCALLPKLNFSNDPQLTHILEQAKTHLAVHTGAELKDSRVLRSQVASKAQEIEGLMAAFMGMQPEPMEVESDRSLQLRLVA
ncbi:hypothetical protein BHUM_05433c [Candidatus Burkholderia humilis]|nr:hypothetical protein BHUM_05433c [Candidatus Burkholderia humilis]